MNCPSCGSGIGFRSERAPYTVCSSCQTMLLRKDLNVEALGKVAECQMDGTAIQLGAEGSHDGKAFQVIGRIQLKYAAGYWNEWYLLYSDGTNGWMGEALGQFFLSTEEPDASQFADYSQYELGASIEYDGKDWIVLDLKTVQVHTFEGELPFVVSDQNPYRTIDLRNAEGEGLTVDFSDAKASLYKGRWVRFSELSLSGLNREPDTSIAIPSSQTVPVKCSSCGAPHEISAPGRSQLLVCQYCGTSLDATTPELQDLGRLMDRAEEIAKWAKIPIGTLAQLPDGQYKVIGMMENSCTVDGRRYSWKDYLLYNHLLGYRWVNENNGHYMLFEQLYEVPLAWQRKNLFFSKAPAGMPPRNFLLDKGNKFRHFSTSHVVVDRVVGEFYWRVSTAERSVAYDYVNPPEMISASTTQDDITWTRGRYLDKESLGTIFPSIEFEKPTGVAPAQPNPWDKARKAYTAPVVLGFLVACLITMSGFFSPEGQVLMEKESAQVLQGASQAQGASAGKSFKIPGEGRRSVAVTISSDLKDRWFDGQAYIKSTSSRFNRGGHFLMIDWKGKGTKKRTVIIPAVPAGEDLNLTFMGNFGPPKGTPPIVAPKDQSNAGEIDLSYKVQTLPSNPNYGMLILYIMAALVPFGILGSRKSSFEKKRWYESDYG